MIEWLPALLMISGGFISGFVACALMVNDTIADLENEVLNLKHRMRGLGK